MYSKIHETNVVPKLSVTPGFQSVWPQAPQAHFTARRFGVDGRESRRADLSIAKRMIGNTRGLPQESELSEGWTAEGL